MRWKPDEGIVGESPAMQELAERVARVAASALPVLVRGETGSGKELVARAIHGRSVRATGTFVSENCAALTDTLLEAELFGHEAGSFTGAIRTREGLFNRANGGTLFIDEIGDMSPAMQAKLLRVLEDGEVRRLGGNEVVRVDVRIIAATHRDLHALVREGRFRQDLLFRLAVLEVEVPPLRERLADIPLLAEHFLARFAEEQRRSAPQLLSEEVLDRLLAHDWPGNVRELENALRVASIFSYGSVLEASELPFRSAPVRDPLPGPAAVASYAELLEFLDTTHREFIANALERSHGNKAAAARRLNITRYALYRTMKRLGIEAEEAPAAVAV